LTINSGIDYIKSINKTRETQTMTDLFNLCEVRFRLYRKRLCAIKLPFMRIEFFVPKVYTTYIETYQEAWYDCWAEYEKSGDPDDIPF
jgi:hypothetical protein